jgi:hypothetical protein
MPETITVEQLEAWKTLLREGRVTEADNQINAAEEQLKIAEEQARMQQPAAEPKTDEELLAAFFQTVCDILGNPPRLTKLLVEMRGRAEKRE